MCIADDKGDLRPATRLVPEDANELIRADGPIVEVQDDAVMPNEVVLVQEMAIARRISVLLGELKQIVAGLRLTRASLMHVF
jgi:hypothetical protein